MFVTPSGRRFVLSHYTLGEWAAIMQAALLSLGCSEAYAEAVYREYADAERVEAK